MSTEIDSAQYETLYKKCESELADSKEVLKDLRVAAAGYAEANGIEWDEDYIGEEVGVEELKSEAARAEEFERKFESEISCFESVIGDDLRGSYRLMEFKGSKIRANKLHSKLIGVYLEMTRVDEMLENRLRKIDQKTEFEPDFKDNRSQSEEYRLWTASKLSSIGRNHL